MAANKHEYRPSLFENISQEFRNHLIDPENRRIIISGKFGTGKTFFIDKFFQRETQELLFEKVKFKAYHIFPINYVIASNEDISNYLKYDILLEMISKGIQTSGHVYEKTDTIPSFAKSHKAEFFRILLSMVPKVGRTLSDIFDSIISLYDKFEEFASDKIKSEGDILAEFMERIENIPGSLYQNDIIKKLINKLLSTRGVEENNQETQNSENILIIDDLDRIDPNHIFRILNIFAAHLNYSNELKFNNSIEINFDKIILVCDINNIRNIFHSKFGSNSDFNGYIDKFYSKNIFYFQNRKSLEIIANEAFKNIEYNNKSEGDIEYWNSFLFRDNSLPRELFKLFVNYGEINLRTLLVRINSRTKFEPNRELILNYNSTVKIYSYLILAHFEILKQLMQGYGAVNNSVNKLPLAAIEQLNNEAYFCQLSFFIYNRQPIRSNVTVDFELNNLPFRLEIPENIISPTMENIQLYFQNEKINEVVYSKLVSNATFKVLLLEFIDMLHKVDAD